MRGGDSFAAFEEVLIQSKAQKADLLLLGGDLFHDNKPSRNTLHRCARLRRRPRPPRMQQPVFDVLSIAILVESKWVATGMKWRVQLDIVRYTYTIQSGCSQTE